MPGKRISDLTALTGAGSASTDDLVIFDTDASATKRITRAQLAVGMQADTQTLTNKTIDSANNTLTVNAKEATLEATDGSRVHEFKDVAALLADTGLVATTGSIVRTRSEGFAYSVAASGASDHDLVTAGGVKLYVLPDAKGTRAIEAFGLLSTPPQVAAAISTALGSLTDGQSLVQIAASYTTDAVAKVVAVSGIAVRLNLVFSGTGANAAFSLNGATNSLIDVSVDAGGASVHGVRLDNCGYSTVPRSCRISNINGTSQVVAGLFLRDCPDMIVEPVISSVTGNGNYAVRGVMVSDQTISHNASRISPVLNNITVATGGAVDDADGVYAENSVSNHYGGIQCIGGTYNNCQKRNIKISSARPVIRDNKGTNSLAVPMYAFVSSYDKEAGHIVDNDFSKTGSEGVVYMLDAGEQGGGTGDTRLFARGNRMRSATVAASSRGFRLDGRLAHVEIGPHEIIGAQGLLQSYGNTANTVQQIGMYGPIRFDNLSASGANCVILTGNFSRLRIEGVNCVNAVASFFFLQAVNCSDRIAEIIGVNQSYSFGFMSGGIRPMTAYDQTAGALNSIRYERGLVVHRRNSAPTSGAHIVGDLVERHSPSAGGKVGWVCTTAGTPGTWKEWGAIDP